MVFDKAFKRLGRVGAWQKLDLTLVRNGVSACELTMPAGHPLAVKMQARGTRLVVTEDEDDVQLFSGVVRGMAGSGPGDDQVTYRAKSDHQLLNRILAWPDPAATLFAQPAYKRYRQYSLETALKHVTEVNAARLGVPLSIVGSQARGGTVNIDFRFDPILEKLQPLLDESDLTVKMEQIGSGVRLDVTVARQVRKELSVGSGALVSYDWDSEVFDGTEAVVAGQGEGAARTIRRWGSVARREQLGFPEEIFVDARDIDDALELPDRGRAKLAESRETSGLSLKLTETPSFRYGVHYNLGDTVTVQTAAGPITDRIKQIQITADRNNGKTITPIVGDRTDAPEARLFRFIRKLAGSQSALERR